MIFSKNKEEITSFQIVTLHTSGMRLTAEYEIVMKGNDAEVSEYFIRYSKNKDERVLERRAVISAEAALGLLNDCRLISWDGFHGAHPRGVLDGTMFSLKAVVNEGRVIKAEGSQNFPKRYREFTDGLYGILSEADKKQE